VRTLATRTGFSPSFISQVEVDVVSPSLASLQKIAAELGVSLAQLFTSLESAPRMVVRADERMTYESTWSQTLVEALTDAAPGRKLSAVQVTFEAGGASGKRTARSPHDTFAFVLAGTLVLSIENESVELSAGDAVYLVERSVGAWENQSTEQATLVLVGVSGQPAALIDVVVDDVHPLS